MKNYKMTPQELELELLKQIETLPQKPSNFYLVRHGEYVAIPKKVSQYFSKIGYKPKLESNGMMLVDNFDTLILNFGFKLVKRVIDLSNYHNKKIK